MPDWIRALWLAGTSCLFLARGVCQDDLFAQITKYEQETAANPASSLAHYRLAEAYFQQRNYQSAANEFREALNGDLEPVWTELRAHIRLGEIFEISGQHDRAVNEYQQAQRENLKGELPADSVATGEPIQRTEPEYTEEARVAGLEGAVVLRGEIGEDGFAGNLSVATSLGLGLDEKAIDAVKQWHFQPIAVRTQIRVDFRLPSPPSRWHLIKAEFHTPAGVSRPSFVRAPYPIGAGIGPEAIEEGRLVAAMGRLASATLVFDVDEHGTPVHFQIPYSSADVWGSEASALVGTWRFAPGTKFGIPVSVPCTVRLVWGERELDPPTVTQMRREMDEQVAASPDVFLRPALATGTLWVDPQAQAAKLVVKTPPEYPSFARAAGLRGTVRFHVLIGVDGRLRQAEMMSGHPALTDAAAEAVKQWVYQATLLNGTQVEVTTEVDVDVGPPQ